MCIQVRRAFLYCIPALMAAAATMGGCRSVGGPCYHTYHDPVLRLEVQGTLQPATLAVTDLTIDGRLVGSLEGLVTDPAFRARAVTDTIYCDVPCGFSTLEGQYAFVASAPGYRPEPLSIAVNYRNFDGGCPSANSGSTVVRLTFIRVP